MRGSRVVATLFLALAAMACQADELPIRKAASSGIFHDPSSPNYSEIKPFVARTIMAECYDSRSGRFTEIVHFTACRDMKDCVADGGRDPSN